MEKEYWLQRISHEWEVSYALLEKGYITLGWSAFADSGILEAARIEEKDYKTFNELCREKKQTIKSRWDMWYFAQFKKGDTIVVPLNKGEFQILCVEEPAVSIKAQKNKIEPFSDKNGNSVVWGDDGFLYRNSKIIDIGFIIRVSPLTERISRRDYAGSKLSSRMKMRQTNGHISDLSEVIEETIDSANNNKPINFYEEALEIASDKVLEKLTELLEDTKFEKLVKAYMEKIGADDAYIPAKNEAFKEDRADADVIARFDNLKIAIIVQVKKHDNETDEEAVNQITKYKELLDSDKSELSIDDAVNYANIPWVISACDHYSPEAIEAAEKNKVQLFTGKEFARMLVDAGLKGVDV